MDLTIRPLTPELWPALEDLFGRAGASNGCWCMYWRLGADYKLRPREQNRQALRTRTEGGPPPGLLAFDGELAVGWCQVTPRRELPWLEAQFARHVDDAPVWSISCFYIRRGCRRRGVTPKLIAAALRVARDAGAPALEAYPVDTEVLGSTSNIFTGTASTFRRAGFRTIATRSPSRPIMRHEL